MAFIKKEILKIWRTWINSWVKPFIISFIVSIILKIIIYYIPENAIITDFFAGWICAGIFLLCKRDYDYGSTRSNRKPDEIK
jgi:hypothetical protein